MKIGMIHSCKKKLKEIKLLQNIETAWVPLNHVIFCLKIILLVMAEEKWVSTHELIIPLSSRGCQQWSIMRQNFFSPLPWFRLVSCLNRLTTTLCARPLISSNEIPIKKNLGSRLQEHLPRWRCWMPPSPWRINGPNWKERKNRKKLSQRYNASGVRPKINHRFHSSCKLQIRPYGFSRDSPSV